MFWLIPRTPGIHIFSGHLSALLVCHVLNWSWLTLHDPLYRSHDGGHRLFWSKYCCVLPDTTSSLTSTLWCKLDWWWLFTDAPHVLLLFRFELHLLVILQECRNFASYIVFSQWGVGIYLSKGYKHLLHHWYEGLRVKWVQFWDQPTSYERGHRFLWCKHCSCVTERNTFTNWTAFPDTTSSLTTGRNQQKQENKTIATWKERHNDMFSICRTSTAAP